MLNELVQTVLDRLEGKAYSDTLVATMVSDHNGWGVTLPMSDALFAAWVDALAESQGCQTSDRVAVWQRQLAALREHVRFLYRNRSGGNMTRIFSRFIAVLSLAVCLAACGPQDKSGRLQQNQ